MARPIPVFPLVASKIVFSLVSSPRSSALTTMNRAGRSFIDPPGLKLSSFARTLTFLLRFSFRSSTNGVLPIMPRMSLSRFSIRGR
jgi:hypothetical protein